jgi:hypothetical protein
LAVSEIVSGWLNGGSRLCYQLFAAGLSTGFTESRKLFACTTILEMKQLAAKRLFYSNA